MGILGLVLLTVQLTIAILIDGVNGTPKTMLYKCPRADLKEDFLQIPENNWISHHLENLQSLPTNSNVFDSYKFTLVETNEGSFTGCQFGTHETFSIMIQKDINPAKNVMYNFTRDGWLAYTVKNSDIWPEEVYLPSNSYCVLKATEESIYIEVCKSQCYHQKKEKGSTLCLPKCCPLGQVMTSEEVCMDQTMLHTNWPIYSSLKELTSVKIQPTFLYNIDGVHWTCPEGKNLTWRQIQAGKLKILSSGEIFAKTLGHGNRWKKIYSGLESPRSFCIDILSDVHQDGEESYVMNGEKSSGFFTLFCKDDSGHSKFPSDEQRLGLYSQILFGITLLSAMIHLSVFAIFLSLWSTQGVHGCIVMAVSCAHFLLYFTLTIYFGVSGFGDLGNVLISSEGSTNVICVAGGILVHFLILVTFAWTTALSADVYICIRSMTPTPRAWCVEKTEFLKYSCFSLGLPALTVFCAIVMEYTLGEDSRLYPGYRRECLIGGGEDDNVKWNYIFYISIPISLLFGANMIFALLTLRAIQNAKRNIKILKDSSMSSSSRNRTRTALKLFVLMGILLCFEFVVSFVNLIDEHMGFMVVDFYRIFHALGCFWIFVCNRKILSQLQKRFKSRPSITPTSFW